MRLQPIVYVTDMDRALRWYAALLGCEPVVRGGYWSSFALGDAQLALHLSDDAPVPGGVELSLVVTEPLEAVIGRVTPVRGIADEAFGRSIVVADPDGTRIQVNEHDPELYDQ